MNVEQATAIIIRPHITEKTFSMVENEQKICFLVKKEASKPMIQDAVKVLYNENSISVQTARTIYGKKAFVKFESVDKARDLATKIGML
jgi:large subunit ribosomal protein L23|tara:strand:- start:2699 stop:2965 length:267 start_codon:yes stop_codon:yes gene_type:complete